MTRAHLYLIARWHDFLAFMATIRRDDMLQIMQDAEKEVVRAADVFALADFDLRTANTRRDNAWYAVQKAELHKAMGIR